MIAVCTKCHTLFETTTEEAYTPGVLCVPCYRAENADSWTPDDTADSWDCVYMPCPSCGNPDIRVRPLGDGSGSLEYHCLACEDTGVLDPEELYE